MKNLYFLKDKNKQRVITHEYCFFIIYFLHLIYWHSNQVFLLFASYQFLNILGVIYIETVSTRIWPFLTLYDLCMTPRRSNSSSNRAKMLFCVYSMGSSRKISFLTNPKWRRSIWLDYNHIHKIDTNATWFFSCVRHLVPHPCQKCVCY